MEENMKTGAKSSGNEGKIIFSIAFVSFMVSVDTYVVNISLPTIARYFHVDTGEVSWVVLAYLLSVTGTLLIFGRLGDRFGLKRVFITGFGVFTLASLLCGMSGGIYILIFSRFLQGVGGAMLLSMAPAMIPKFLSTEHIGRAFGYYATSAALGITLGTPLGGIITGYASWHWIFLINVPTGLAAIWYCYGAIPSDAPAPEVHPDEKFDSLGAILVFAGLSSLVYSLNMGKETGWTSPVILATLTGGIALLTWFVLWERKATSPLLDLSLFQDKAFTFGNLASCFAVAFQAGSNFLLPFYLERLLGLKPQHAGFVILVYSIIYMIGSLYTGKLSDRLRPRILCTWAMVTGAGAALWFALTLGSGGLAPVIVFLVALAVAYALFIPSNNNLVMSMAPEGKHGVVSGLFRMGIYVSLVAGVVVFETVFNLFSPGGAETANLTATAMKPGFVNAYYLGAIFCALSVIFSLMGDNSKKGKIQETLQTEAS